MNLILNIVKLWLKLMLTLMLGTGILAGLAWSIKELDNWLRLTAKAYEPFLLVSILLAFITLVAAIIVVSTE